LVAPEAAMEHSFIEISTVDLQPGIKSDEMPLCALIPDIS
jgi:hypothetical protein